MGVGVGETVSAGSAASTLRVWRFAKAVLDERTQVLSVDGNVVELERKPLEVLMHLLQHAGDVVTKDELLAAVWPGRIVSDTVLTKTIGKLREVFADDAQTLIKTVHGYGYRLIAPVQTQVARGAAPAHFDFKPGDHPPLRPHWSLLRRLGTGGHGEAWLVRHDKTKESRVFKFALDEQSLSALKREITLFRLLRDTLQDKARIVTLLDWNLEQAPYFIEAEYAAGGSLTEWTTEHGGAGAVPMTVRTEIVAQIADALATVHSVGILHKDLKPSNVLVESGADESPRILLGDLGSGGILDASRLEAMGITRLGFTQTVSMLSASTGTPLYFAPELLAGQPPTVQADIYALGVLLYQMVVGDLYRPLSAGWERDVDDELLRADIAIAAEGNPEHRLANAAELARRLRNLNVRRSQLAEERKALLKAEAVKLAAERMRARRAALVFGFAAMAVGVVISTWLYFDARTARVQAEKDAASAQAVADFLSTDMFAVVGTRPLKDLTVRELLEAASNTLASRVEQTPEAAAKIHAALGGAFVKIESIAEAEKHLGQALDLYEQLGTSATGMVSAAGQLVLMNSATGTLPSTLSRHEDILARGERELGKQHPSVLSLKHDLAQGLLGVGDWPRATELLGSLIEDARLAPSIDGVLIGGAETLLGYSLLRLGKFDASVSALIESKSRLSASLGPAHREFARAREFHGLTLVELESFDEAEAELLSALELMRTWAPDENSAELLSIKGYSGFLKLRRGKVNEAVQMLEYVVEGLAAMGWDVDPALEYRTWLAQAYHEGGRLGEAEATIRKALDLGEPGFGTTHPLVQNARIELADILRKRNNPSEARRILATVDAGVLTRLGPNHPYTAELRRVEGLTAFAEGRLSEAKISLKEAARAFEVCYGTNHRFTKRANRELAGLASASAPPGVPREGGL